MNKAYIIVGLVFFAFSCGNNEELTLDCDLSPIELKVSKVVDTGCGNSIGEIQLEALGGNGDFMYSLDGINFQSEFVFTNLAAGEYTISVLDKANCEAQINTTILDDGTVTITDVQTENSDCGASNGSILVTAQGGTGNLMYSLNNGSTQNTGAFSPLSSGTYSIKVTDSNGCVKNVTATISDNNGITINSINKTVAGCGTSVGGITIFVSGGDGNYSYSIDGTNFQGSNNFTGLANGNYTVTIKDNTGCKTSAAVVVISGVSFQQSIRAIIDANCAISGCHVGAGRQDFRQLSVIQSNANGIKSRIKSGSMPKTGSLTSQEIELIVCWVDDGALDN